MLKVMRKYTNNWMTKLIFIIIIASFMLFFGYSRQAGNVGDKMRFIAIVGDEKIPKKLFETSFQSSLQNFKKSFKGDMPEGFSDLIKSNVRSQLVDRFLLAQWCKKMNFTITDQEVADFIQDQLKTEFPNGTFDVTLYENVILPQFRQNRGEHLEDAVRRDLLVEKANIISNIALSQWPKELENMKFSTDKRPPQEETQPTFNHTSDDLLRAWLDDYRQHVTIQEF